LWKIFARRVTGDSDGRLELDAMGAAILAKFE